MSLQPRDGCRSAGSSTFGGAATSDGSAERHCSYGNAITTSAARLILNHRAYIEEEFGLSPSRTLFLSKHALEVRRLLAPANAGEACRVIGALLDYLGHDRVMPAIREAKALVSALESALTMSGTCGREHRDADRIVFVALDVYTRAWDESWARDAFGARFD